MTNENPQTVTTAPKVAAVFQSLVDLNLINDDERLALAGVVPTRAKVRVKTPTKPAPITFPLAFCKPDLLARMAMTFGADVIEVEIFPDGDDTTAIYFAFEINAELARRYAPQNDGQAKAAAVDLSRLETMKPGEILALLWPMLQDLATGQAQINAKLNQQAAQGGEELAQLKDIRDALHVGFLAQVKKWQAEVSKPAPTAAEMLKESTNFIKESTKAHSESLQDLAKLIPQTSQEMKIFDTIMQKATTPEAKQLGLSILRLLGARNIPAPGDGADLGPIEPPGQTPPMFQTKVG